MVARCVDARDGGGHDTSGAVCGGGGGRGGGDHGGVGGDSDWADDGWPWCRCGCW